ncbi:MAG: hypothetical protein M1829_005175 [Trizodia sp. TS-e1964]|nr:MAG: hypothetical protein M1829_005175 [Trizodia sp. TS-e1964]
MAMNIQHGRVFSPTQSISSPSDTPDSGQIYPPPKRQRLSPSITSPYGSSFNTLPPNSASNNFASAQSPSTAPNPHYNNLNSPSSYFNISNAPPPDMMRAGAPPPAATGTMGPPSKPLDKATDTTELADVLTASGVDLKGEEEALTRSYFDQGTTNQAGQYGRYPAGGYDLMVRDAYGNPKGSAYYGVQKTPEQIVEENKKRIARERNEHRALHLNDPFLFSNTLRHKIGKVTYEQVVSMPLEGVFERTTHGYDGSIPKHPATAGFLNPQASLVDILSLVSLATQYRLRGLMEDALLMAEGRRQGSHGVVPPEWSDIAIGSGTAIPTTAPPLTARSGWESAVSPMTTNPLKSSYSLSNKLPTPVSDGPPTPIQTISFPNGLTKLIRDNCQKERDLEEARLAKRVKRSNAKTEASRTSSVAASLPGTPGASGAVQGERAPETTTEKRLTKKEMARQSKGKESDAHQHSHANATSAMMLGSFGGQFGGKKKEYAWMKGSTSSAPKFPGAPTPSALFDNGISAGASTGAQNGPNTLLGPWTKRIGQWREDQSKGMGIQTRDWTSVLEADGRDRKALIKAYDALRWEK